MEATAQLIYIPRLSDKAFACITCALAIVSLFAFSFI